MAGSAGDNDEEMITAINVTPLVDVVLVLLIIMMVTASYIVSKSIQVQRPKAQTGQNTPSQAFTITLQEDGKLFLNTEEINESTLTERAKDKAKDPNALAVIDADGRVRHEKVVRVMDLLRASGMGRFAINVRPEVSKNGAH